MPINYESATPPPRIGKIGPYTVFMTPSPGRKPESLPTIQVQVGSSVQTPSPPPVMAPPAQFYKEKVPSPGFFRDTMAKIQNAHANLDERVARWFGLDQSKYQWALNDFHECNEKSQAAAKPQVRPNKVQNV